MRPIAVIPARGGSRRIKRKNVIDFFGAPLISYSIRTAIESKLFGKIVCSTDDGEIAQIAREYGAEIHMRDPNYGRDEVGTQDVVAECLSTVAMNAPRMIGEYACCIYATAPLLLPEHLSRGYYALADSPIFNYCFSVGYPPLRDAGAFYWGRTNCFIAGIPLIGLYTRLFLMPPDRVCDINTMEDLEECKRMYEKTLEAA